MWKDDKGITWMTEAELRALGRPRWWLIPVACILGFGFSQIAIYFINH